MDTDSTPDPAPRVVTACFRDGRPAQDVTVSLSLAANWLRFIELSSDEPRLIEFVLEKPAGWADGLLPSAHARLAETITEMHGPYVEALERRILRRGQNAAELLRFIGELSDPHRS